MWWSYACQRWVHDDQWWVQDWSGVSPWSSLTSLWRVPDRQWLVRTLRWQLCHKLVVGRFVSHRLVSDDPAPVSDESMKISDESRTGQGWVHDDQWRVQDWYWGESMVIKTNDWQLIHYMGPRPAKDHHWPVPDASGTGQWWSWTGQDLTLTVIS